MKLTSKQQKDLETIMFFRYPGDKKISITDEDIQMFFEYSDRGLHKDKAVYLTGKRTGFHALVEGKRWRGIHMHEIYEPGILDCTMPYYVILGGYKREKPMPRSVVDFMKKEMFQGIDAESIEDCYQRILEEKCA